MSRPEQPPAVQVATGHPRQQRWSWLVPALAFAVGLVLGGTLIAVADGSDDAATPATAQPAPPASHAAQPASEDRTITIPASCEQGLERARTAMTTVGEAVQALRDLDTRRLQELLDRLQDAQREVEALVDRCRTEAVRRN
ncbi:hypothetical protein [Pseudosporangium ferrugineum]|uniref:Uncharacterized protein n=1 Tax=Pseudosporangium ferrugineum TaxID=439699 RepID=A0A2T0RGA7_9ACTN|nr:hypothetical protein [Pseudosporangium ferrugineum]PRY20203.1 hypothetical protein CLV70_12584 [Pseudosporangium ferrugineum]